MLFALWNMSKWAKKKRAAGLSDDFCLCKALVNIIIMPASAGPQLYCQSPIKSLALILTDNGENTLTMVSIKFKASQLPNHTAGNNY